MRRESQMTTILNARIQLPTINEVVEYREQAVMTEPVRKVKQRIRRSDAVRLLANPQETIDVPFRPIAVRGWGRRCMVEGYLDVFRDSTDRGLHYLKHHPERMTLEQKAHYEAIVARKKEPTKCPQCGGYVRRDNLNRHKRLHCKMRAKAGLGSWGLQLSYISIDRTYVPCIHFVCYLNLTWPY